MEYLKKKKVQVKKISISYLYQISSCCLFCYRPTVPSEEVEMAADEPQAIPHVSSLFLSKENCGLKELHGWILK